MVGNVTILSGERITRAGERLGEQFLLDVNTAYQDANIGRALYIGNCEYEKSLKHISHIIKTIHNYPTIIVTPGLKTIENLEEIIDFPDIHICFVYDKSDIAKANIYIITPENISLLLNHINTGIQLIFLHIVDGYGWITRSKFKTNPSYRTKIEHIGEFKARCEASGISPYIIIWSSLDSKSVFISDLYKDIGIDAFIYIDSDTLKTACYCYAQHPEPDTTENIPTHWIDEYLYQTYTNNTKIIFLPPNNSKTLAEIAEAKKTQILHLQKELEKLNIEAESLQFSDFESKFLSLIYRYNKKILPITDMNIFWKIYSIEQMVELLINISDIITPIVELPICTKEQDIYRHLRDRNIPFITIQLTH